MVTSGGIYLADAEDTVLFLCDKKMGKVPIGIAIEDFSALTEALKIKNGERFWYRENMLGFSGGILVIEPIPMPEEEKISPPVNLLLVKQAGEELLALASPRGLAALVGPLVLGGERDGILSKNPYAKEAYPHLFRLKQCLSKGDAEAVYASATALFGLGLGLTPSADDVLLGMIYTFHRFSYETPASRAICRAVALEAPRRTNRISAAYLQAVVEGESFYRMERVLQGLVGQIPLEIRELTELGSSSGGEMLLGVLIALDIFYNMI